MAQQPSKWVVLTVLRFLPAMPLFRKGMRCSRIWRVLPIVHSLLEPTCAQVSAQWRMNNNLDYYQNNVVFIKQETCPSQEKQKMEFWWLLGSHLGMWVDYLMRMACPFFFHVAEAHDIQDEPHIAPSSPTGDWTQGFVNAGEALPSESLSYVYAVSGRPLSPFPRSLNARWSAASKAPSQFQLSLIVWEARPVNSPAHNWTH